MCSGLLQHANFIATGLIIFSLTEYNLSIVFENEKSWIYYLPKTHYFYFTHFMLRGVHLAYPQDRYRLCVSPIIGLSFLKCLYIPVINLMVSSESHQPGYIVGIILGYLLRDLIHYAIHHGHFTNVYLK